MPVMSLKMERHQLSNHSEEHDVLSELMFKQEVCNTHEKKYNASDIMLLLNEKSSSDE